LVEVLTNQDFNQSTG